MSIHNSTNLLKIGNESSFLPNREKIKFHSIILLEIFNFEDFPNLIRGLKKLYNELSNSHDAIIFNDYSRIEQVIKGLKNPNGTNLFFIRLPSIFNKNNPDTLGVNLDLGSNFRYIGIGLYRISSSLVTIQIDARLESNISDELNKLIYKEYEEEDTLTRYPNGYIKSESSPEALKRKEIANFRLKLKTELINYLSIFFEGQFFKLCEKDYSIVPSIDLYSLNYPKTNNEILKWGQEFSGFLDCFGVRLNKSRTYKSNQYMLFNEIEFKYPNSIILANRHLIKRDGETEYLLSAKPFCILAINRLVYIYKNILGQLNSTISNEIQNLEKNQLNELLENRNKISKKIYYFKRFKIEFEQLENKKNKLDFHFKSIEKNEDESYNLFDIINDQIIKKTTNIDHAIDTLNQNSNLILNLKNIENSNNLQSLTYRLTWIIIGLTILTIILHFF